VPDALAIYLTDHFAGATLGVELVGRCRRNNQGSRFGPPLDEIAKEIEADRRTLAEVMGRLGVKPSVYKTSVAWTIERVSRLIPKGRLLAYTPLSRVVELEGLVSGIAGKRALWRVLDAVSARDARLAAFDFGALAERAERQLADVERLRFEAAAIAFGFETAEGQPRAE
jgi:hypothetical protein